MMAEYISYNISVNMRKSFGIKLKCHIGNGSFSEYFRNCFDIGLGGIHFVFGEQFRTEQIIPVFTVFLNFVKGFVGEL